MTEGGQGDTVTSGSLELRWDAPSRVASLAFSGETQLTGKHGAAMVDALTRWIGESKETFALLADCRGVTATDAGYRSATGDFFGAHREAARIALVNLGPVIRVVAEMFRIGIRIHLKTFPDEASARAWLRTQGVAA
jgi:hypothetical protein